MSKLEIVKARIEKALSHKFNWHCYTDWDQEAREDIQFLLKQIDLVEKARLEGIEEATQELIKYRNYFAGTTDVAAWNWLNKAVSKLIFLKNRGPDETANQGS